MKVELLRYPSEQDWERCKAFALNTVGKEYSGGEISSDWKRRILAAEHSPIRTLMFTVRMHIPYYVSVHFVRHKYGVEHYVTSQRNDRQDKYDRTKAPQDMEVCHIMDLNAQALINMAHRRLCGNADPETRRVMVEICREVVGAVPEMWDVLMPMCMYRAECHEFNSCGFLKNMVEGEDE